MTTTDTGKWFAWLRQGAVPELSGALASSPALATVAEPGGMPGLFIAVMRDDVAVVELLLGHGAKTDGWVVRVPRGTMSSGEPPPTYPIVFARSRAVCEALVKRGADIQHASVARALNCDPAFAAWLLDQKGVVDEHALLVAARLDRLLDRCVKAATEEARQRAVTRAVLDREAACLHRLLQRVVPKDAMLLADAAARGEVELVQALIAAGVDPNARTASGSTALIDAASAGSSVCVRLLLEAGADASLRTPRGKSALDGATAVRDPGLVEMLVSPRGR